MNAYSLDLRKKIVQAKQRGTPTSEVARSFGVGVSTVKRYAATAREGRTLAPKKNAPVPGRRWTRPPADSWRRTSKAGRRPRFPKDASSWRGWPVFQ